MKFKRNIIAALLNFDGTIGKTTIADHQISPRLGSGTPRLKKFRIETLNAGGHEGDGTRVVDSTKLNAIACTFVAARSNMLLDIGSSNVKDVIAGLRKLEGFSDRITHWLVPTTPDLKVHEGTLATVSFLLSLGVDPGTVTVLPNRVNADTFASDFSRLQNVLVRDGIRFCPIGIKESDVFKLTGNRTITQIAEDHTNYDELLSELSDEQIEDGYGEEYAQHIVTRMLALAVNKEMDDAFRWIFRDDLVEA